MRNAVYYLLGLGFLLLAKVKHSVSGYTSPKPFDSTQIERCVDYDIRVVDQWLVHLERYCERPDCIEGKNVLELGPGSDLGVGLYLLARGAATYSACDVNDLASSAPSRLYEELFERLRARYGGQDIELLRRELSSLPRNESARRLNYVIRVDFAIDAAFEAGSIDLVFSQAAFEHFDDVDETVQRLSAVCAPGAVIVAEIDLMTHSRWIREKDPNNIYRFGPTVYRMLRFRGSPNRLRPRDYTAAFERGGWCDVSIVPVSALEKQPSSGMARGFRDPASQMELLSVVLCARRPAEVD